MPTGATNGQAVEHLFNSTYSVICVPFCDCLLLPRHAVLAVLFAVQGLLAAQCTHVFPSLFFVSFAMYPYFPSMLDG